MESQDAKRSPRSKPKLDANDRTHFHYPVGIEAADIDVHDHVNNIVYLRWVQDAAVAHWMAVVDENFDQNLIWVVARHEIDYKRPLVRGDDVVIHTWVEPHSAATSVRYCEIQKQPEGELVAKARTIWCLYNTTTGRPQRIPAAVERYFTDETPGQNET